VVLRLWSARAAAATHSPKGYKKGINTATNSYQNEGKEN